MMVRRILYSFSRLLIIVAAFSLSGCQRPYYLSKDYTPAPAVNVPQKADILYVGSLKDLRPPVGEGDVGKGLIAFVPFVPYANQKFPDYYLWRGQNTPIFMMDSSIRSQMDDLKPALEKDLTASGLASTVRFVDANFAWPRSQSAGRKDYYLAFDLETGVLSRKFYTYGVSFAALGLWAVGLPVADAKYEFQANARLLDATGKVIAEKKVSGIYPFKQYNILLLFPYTSGGNKPTLEGAYAPFSADLRKMIQDGLAK